LNVVKDGLVLWRRGGVKIKTIIVFTRRTWRLRMDNNGS
jgi:hypothetical protein